MNMTDNLKKYVGLLSERLQTNTVVVVTCDYLQNVQSQPQCYIAHRKKEKTLIKHFYGWF